MHLPQSKGLDPSDPTQANRLESDPVLLRAYTWLTRCLELMGLPAQIAVMGSQQLEIDSASLTDQQKAILLNRMRSEGGEDPDHPELNRAGIPLDALQYLANTLLNLHQPETDQRAFVIELEGYRQQRLEQLEQMASEAVDQVRQTGQPYEFKALSAAERRQLHTYFAEPHFGDLETFSQGKEPDRRLVIRLASASDPQIQAGGGDRADHP